MYSSIDRDEREMREGGEACGWVGECYLQCMCVSSIHLQRRRMPPYKVDERYERKRGREREQCVSMCLFGVKGNGRQWLCIKVNTKETDR